MSTILVTGATGNVGSQVVRELRTRGAPTRAFVRDPEKAGVMLGEDVEVAVGDFADAASIRRALDGVGTVFLTSGDGPQKVEHETAVIDAAAGAGVSRIVKLTTLGARAGSPLPPFDWHGRIEEHLAWSGVPAVILRSNFFMSNLLLSAEPVRREGQLIAPAGRGRIGMIDPRDVAAAAAVLLTTPGHEGKEYVVTGPAAITFQEVADDLTAATGRTVTYVDVPPNAARAALVAAGMPDWLVQHLHAIFGVIREDGLAVTTGTVRDLTGREPRRFADFARDHAAAFGAGTPVQAEGDPAQAVDQG